MNLPQQYPYNLQWRFIGFGFASSAGLLILGRSSWVFTTLGIIMSVFTLVLTARRLLVRRFLELGHDALLLPSGFLRIRYVQIPYAEIESMQPGPGGTIQIRSKARTFEILPAFLPDAESYQAIGDFLFSRLKEEAKKHPRPQPSEPLPIDGNQYCFSCSYEGHGEILDSESEVLWRFKTEGRSERPPKFTTVPLYGFFRLPDFVVYDKAEKELLRIKRERRLPKSRFVMIQNRSRVCTIKPRGFLFNKHILDFADGTKWSFHMPLFTVFFKGASEAGNKVLVRLQSHNLWYVLIEKRVYTPQLIAALAFIHRERLRCG